MLIFIFFPAGRELPADHRAPGGVRAHRELLARVRARLPRGRFRADQQVRCATLPSFPFTTARAHFTAPASPSTSRLTLPIDAHHPSPTMAILLPRARRQLPSRSTSPARRSRRRDSTPASSSSASRCCGGRRRSRRSSGSSAPRACSSSPTPCSSSPGSRASTRARSRCEAAKRGRALASV